MATGGTVLADTEALHLSATIPDHVCQAVWACQDMITIECRLALRLDGYLHLSDQDWVCVR